MKRLLSFCSLFLCFCTIGAQEKPILPLDIPISFSGTYGELRHDHFHSGYDFRTGGKVGDPIHAIKSGYISRISVSVSGFVNAVYITHPDSTVSVYGHMLSFSDYIAKMVKEEQYSKRSYNVSISPAPGEMPVIQGDIIGKVGSTGASAGPHLHLEVRELPSETPINYLQQGYYEIEDKVPPVFQKIIFYGFCDSLQVPFSYKLRTISRPVSNGTVVMLPAKSYIGIDAVDKQPGTWSKLAIEEYRVTLDTTLIFRFKIGNIPWSEDRYIQSLIEYRESYRGGDDIVRTYIEPGNLLSCKIASETGGLVVLDDYREHKLNIDVEDEHGNTSSLSYKVKRDDSISHPDHLPDTLQSVQMLWFAPNVFKNKEITFAVPTSALYSSINFPYNKIMEAQPHNGIYSSVWKMGDESVPMHRPAYLKINCNIPDTLRSKALIARYSNGRLYYAGGKWEEGGVSTHTRFGTYCVSIDTIAPTISFQERKGVLVNSNGQAVIYVKDEFSGVQFVSVEVDGEWVLSQFKRGKVTAMIERGRYKKGRHTMTVIAQDNCGNETIVNKEFNW